MPPHRLFPALVVAIVAAAAMGPPAAAAPDEGGGALAGSPPPPARGDSGGAGVGHAPAKHKQKRKRKRRAEPTSAKLGKHRFPIAGPFSWGTSDGRFGARRKGHRHQGQDLPAASGTPVVAPYRGVVAAVQYQARGAGHYVVIHSADYDYMFMHLLSRSTVVREGQRVRTGQRLATVGSTGESSGPHLHFEIWVGGWFAGGHAIDPLPLLEEWSGLSRASG
jgi:murein DD-endopeptidase MepM/ murein hydrolase activator NlpD